jgi:hypothetical protein
MAQRAAASGTVKRSGATASVVTPESLGANAVWSIAVVRSNNRFSLAVGDHSLP